MSLPETHVRRIAVYCAGRVPEHLRGHVQVVPTVHGSTVTIIEIRPPWDGSDRAWTRRPIAQLRHNNGRWRLWWPDRRTTWHPVDAPAAHSPEPLLEVLDDPTRAPFW